MAGELVAITLHTDGTFGVMSQDGEAAQCTCGWNEYSSPAGHQSVLLYPVETLRQKAKRRLEGIRRIAWEDRLRKWMSAHVALTAAGYPLYDPPAPEGTPENQRWANWFAYEGDDALNVALVRSYGCRCVYPLLGWTVPPPWTLEYESHQSTPRCRTCNAEKP